MSDEESEGEVPVCGSFEPQVWRKGYCRNCFHPGNKHLGGNLIIEDDKRKFGKENVPKKTDRSSKDDESNDKVKPLKHTGQESGKAAKDKISDKVHGKQLDKEKTSFRDRFEKLQKDKAKQNETISNRKLGSEMVGVDKKSIPDKRDSSKNIPPPVAPKTKGLDKLKSKSTSDITEAIKSPVGNTLFKPVAQKDTLDKSKSKFGSAENVSKVDKNVEGKIKLKSGSAENLAADKSGSSQKPDKNKTDSSDVSKPDYRSLLSSKTSKPEDKPKEKTSAETRDKVVKSDKETKGDITKPKLDLEASKKESPLKLIAQLKSPSPSGKSPLLEKDKPDFKTKFEKPELKSSKEEERDKKDTYEKPKLKSVQESEKKDVNQKVEKPELKSIQEKGNKDDKAKLENIELKSSTEKDKKDDKSKYEKPELKSVEDKEKKDDQSKYEKPELKSVQDKERKDDKSKYEKPELKSVQDKEKIDDKSKHEKPELKSVQDKEKKDDKSKYEKPELKSVQDKEKKDDKSKYEKLELKSVQDKDKKDDKSKYEKPELKSVQDKDKKDDKSKYEKPELKSVHDKDKKDDKSKYEKPELKSVQDKDKKDDKSKYEKPELKSVHDKDKQDDKSKYEKPELKSVQDKEKKDDKSKYEKPELKSVQDKEKKDDKSIYEKPELKSVQDKEKKDDKSKYEKSQIKATEEKEKKDYKAKFEKPGLNKIEEKAKVDYKSKYEKPDLKNVGEPEKKDYKSKYEKPELTKVEEKEKVDYKTKYEKPELKIVEEKEKKDYKAKFEKPELKSSKTEDKKKDDKDDSKKKSSVVDRIAGLKVSQDKSNVKDENTDKSGSVKGKWQPKGSAEEKDTSKTAGLKTDLKSGLKSIKTDDKNKTSVTGGKGLQEKDKNKASPANKWLSSLDTDKNKENKVDDLKSKSNRFQLKSVKTDEKVKDKESKSVINDLKSKSIKDDKVDFKKGLFDFKKAKTVDDSEKDAKIKLDKSSLKSRKADENEKKDFKAKFEKPQLKSTKPDENESAHISKSDKQELKRAANDISVDKKSEGILKEKSSTEEDREIIDNELNQKAEIESIKQKTDPTRIEDVNANLELTETDSLMRESQVNGENTSSDTRGVKSVPPANYSQKSDNLSSDAETDYDEPDNACALIGARGSSPVHVDTQVFTSSRNKTAGVESTKSDLFTTTPQKGLSESLSSENFIENQKRAKSEEKETLKNDELSDIVAQKTSEEGLQKERSKPGIEHDVEKLKTELLKMAEKCEQLEEENESLKHGLSTKESDHSTLEKQKREVEGLILGLQDQLKSMEDRCIRLESDNSNLLTTLKKQEETSKSQPVTEESEEIQDGIQYSESMVEDLIEENENLRQEIQDQKVEMEEMYDSFRDQEAEEFRELQKELEITAKNCRILQFKMRKAERRNEQLEDDRNLFVDKLRILQNQFENKDAVAHIKTLEQELKVRNYIQVL